MFSSLECSGFMKRSCSACPWFTRTWHFKRASSLCCLHSGDVSESLFLSVQSPALILCLLWAVLALSVVLVGPRQASFEGCACGVLSAGCGVRKMCVGPLVLHQISQGAVAVEGVWLSRELDYGWPWLNPICDGGGGACVGAVGGSSYVSGGGCGARVLTKYALNPEWR